MWHVAVNKWKVFPQPPDAMEAGFGEFEGDKMLRGFPTPGEAARHVMDKWPDHFKSDASDWWVEEFTSEGDRVAEIFRGLGEPVADYVKRLTSLVK